MAATASAVLSIDVEDWFHILDVPSTPPLAQWNALPSRVEASFRTMLDLFAEKKVRTTLFFLAWVAERYPHLVREAQAGGHEIASHGHAHELVYRQDAATFSADIRKAKDILEQVAGVAVRGYRAPGFSVTQATPWFFDAVRGAGHTYDSSVFPGSRGHGGLPDALDVPHVISTAHGDLVEFPIPLASFLGKRLYFFGGGYLRFFPYPLIRRKAGQVLREGRPVVVYLHPREVDPGHPRLPMSMKRRFMTYYNLRSTLPKLRRLCDDLPLTTFADLAETGRGTFPDQVAMKKVLFLYTELAPYFLACVARLVKEHPVEVHIVRWPVNKEAPFDLRFAGRVTVHERNAFDDAGLLALVRSIAPDIAFASGWVDKGYLRACKTLHGQGIPTVMCSDTAWRGDLRQRAAAAAACLWLHGTFSHAWVTGQAQAIYARKLGFHANAIRTGFYAADAERFIQLGADHAPSKAQHFPHRFLCVARYIPSKGQQYMCNAFAAMCEHNEAGDWELWIAGTGEAYEAVSRSAAGEHPRIKHLGFVQTEDLGEVMGHCGVFVLPSLYEPWGVVVHEMACAGMPLVLSSAVGAKERFLNEPQNGHQFIAGDDDKLRNTLRMMVLCDDDALRTMGAKSVELGRSWTPAQWAQVVMALMRPPHG